MIKDVPSCPGRDIIALRKRSSGTGFTVPGMTEIGRIGGWSMASRRAWFDVLVADRGGRAAGRIVELSAEIVVDMRATGMRVRSTRRARRGGVGAPRGIRAGREPSRAAAPSDVSEPRTRLVVRRFWQRAPTDASWAGRRFGGSSRRDPDTDPQSTEPRPLETASTSTWARPAVAVEQANLWRGDPDLGAATPTPTERGRPGAGPGARREDRVDDCTLFSATACWTAPPRRRSSVNLAAAAAARPTRRAFPLLVDLRPGPRRRQR